MSLHDLYPADWTKRRRKIIKRDGGTCNECGYEAEAGDGISLHVHHVKPISEGGGHSLDNLITLCEDCHINTHTKGTPDPSRVKMGACQWCERDYPIASSGYGSFCSAVCLARYKTEGIINQIESHGNICSSCYSQVDHYQEPCANCGNWDPLENTEFDVSADEINITDLLAFAYLCWNGESGEF